MQDAGHTNARTKTLGICGNGAHRLRRRFEQKAIDGLLVLVGVAGNLRRQREDDMEILHGQQILGARGRTLTFGAVAILAAVVSNVVMVALGTGRYMPAERLGPLSCM
jgi:hypothetical protein